MDVFLRILSKGEFSMFSFFLVNAFGKGIICSFPFSFISSNSGMFSNSEVLSPISVLPILTSVLLSLGSTIHGKTFPLLRDVLALKDVPSINEFLPTLSE